MGLDIKIPIGLMFSILGLFLTLFGLFTGTDHAMYQQSLGINVNLYTGLLMLVVGILMLLFSRLRIFGKKLKEEIEG